MKLFKINEVDEKDQGILRELMFGEIQQPNPNQEGHGDHLVSLSKQDA